MLKGLKGWQLRLEMIDRGDESRRQEWHGLRSRFLNLLRPRLWMSNDRPGSRAPRGEQPRPRRGLIPNRIYRMDALEGLRRMEDGSVDLVITDPPYNIASAKKRTIQGARIVSTAQAWGSWDTYHPFDYDLLIMGVISECYRVLKDGGALYQFSADEQNGWFIRQAVARGFTCRNQLAMVKRTPLPSLGKRNWRRAFELCMYLTKGPPRTFNFLSQAECVNVFPYTSRFKLTHHPTEKPLGFIRKLVLASSDPGDLVVDPFMGSGTVAVAAKEAGRRFLGFELDQGYVKMARVRLKQTTDS